MVVGHKWVSFHGESDVEKDNIPEYTPESHPSWIGCEKTQKMFEHIKTPADWSYKICH